MQQNDPVYSFYLNWAMTVTTHLCWRFNAEFLADNCFRQNSKRFIETAQKRSVSGSQSYDFGIYNYNASLLAG
jgi:hypothetical protein